MPLEEEALAKLIKAGEIAKRVREEAERLVKPGARLLELAEYIENRIRELGGDPAFPVNIGINEIAAHYTPVPNDELTIPDGSVVKIDIGVHVDGYIADTATTVALNPAMEPLVEASRRALERALSVVRPGARLSEVGRVVEETISSMGFKPIRNLSGHSIDRYTIHAGVSIPNYNELLSRKKFEEGVYAIEPFATNGIGLVEEGGEATIYALRIGRKPRAPEALSLYNAIIGERKGLPFAERWYVRRFGSSLRTALYYLSKSGALISYPVLVERGRGLVSQFEHTVILTGKDVIITTL